MRRLLGAGYGLGWLVLVTLWLIGANSALIALGSLVDWTGWDRPPVDAIISDAHALVFGFMWFGMLVWGLLLVPLGVLWVLFAPLLWLQQKLEPPAEPLPLGVPSTSLPAWDLHACTWVYQTGYLSVAGTWLVWERCTYCQQWRSRKP